MHAHAYWIPSELCGKPSDVRRGGDLKADLADLGRAARMGWVIRLLPPGCLGSPKIQGVVCYSTWRRAGHGS